jgi:hypothetical protein
VDIANYQFLQINMKSISNNVKQEQDLAKNAINLSRIGIILIILQIVMESYKAKHKIVVNIALQTLIQ